LENPGYSVQAIKSTDIEEQEMSTSISLPPAPGMTMYFLFVDLLHGGWGKAVD